MQSGKVDLHLIVPMLLATAALLSLATVPTHSMLSWLPSALQTPLGLQANSLNNTSANSQSSLPNLNVISYWGQSQIRDISQYYFQALKQDYLIGDAMQRVPEDVTEVDGSAVEDLGGLEFPRRLWDSSGLVPEMDKRNFSSMPEWEFEDMYRRERAFTTTMCEQSVRKPEDPEYKNAHIPDILLFLQKGDVNVSEWNRLYHFNNPFGFMGYPNYTLVKEAVDVIPKLTSTQLLPVPRGARDGCIRCAVVGAGGILNGSRMGKEIDSHDYVFRVNAAITAGHEDDVGTRTSVYVHTAHSIISSLMLHKKRGFTEVPHDQGIKYVLIPEAPRDYNFLIYLMKNTKIPSGPYRGRAPRNYYGGHFDERSYYVLHPDFLRYVRNRFLKARSLTGRRWYMFRPTNGAFTLFLALHTCDIVRTYGFSTLDHNNYPNYYYDSQHTRMVFFANHDYRLEMRTWKKLHDRRIMWLYQGKAGDSGS
ncbi:alpha-N-acetylgalactosaminide alpha-2,6-sialyltransferase 2-like [Chanos chanos]|uniref:alpha-N-acetylgalactosaminide alpha-2,6-sialyltransferase n=1 Tax=Chanos chanos TaxID=29144 RepID=A0A6J2VGI6_CHACN|nr:alpha-N-acetylgalactosaminide alpha-2,6-sialyltransferase 2-like [Chanos chanos]